MPTFTKQIPSFVNAEAAYNAPTESLTDDNWIYRYYNSDDSLWYYNVLYKVVGVYYLTPIKRAGMSSPTILTTANEYTTYEELDTYLTDIGDGPLNVYYWWKPDVSYDTISYTINDNVANLNDTIYPKFENADTTNFDYPCINNPSRVVPILSGITAIGGNEGITVNLSKDLFDSSVNTIDIVNIAVYDLSSASYPDLYLGTYQETVNTNSSSITFTEVTNGLPFNLVNGIIGYVEVKLYYTDFSGNLSQETATHTANFLTTPTRSITNLQIDDLGIISWELGPLGYNQHQPTQYKLDLYDQADNYIDAQNQQTHPSTEFYTNNLNWLIFDSSAVIMPGTVIHGYITPGYDDGMTVSYGEPLNMGTLTIPGDIATTSFPNGVKSIDNVIWNDNVLTIDFSGGYPYSSQIRYFVKIEDLSTNTVYYSPAQPNIPGQSGFYFDSFYSSPISFNTNNDASGYGSSDILVYSLSGTPHQISMGTVYVNFINYNFPYESVDTLAYPNEVFRTGYSNPDYITDLSASINGANIELTWTPPNPNGGTISSQSVLISSDSGFATVDASYNIDPSNSTIFSTVAPSQVYYFQVLSINEYGYSGPSNIASETYPASIPDQITNLISTPVTGGGAIRLQWDKPSSNNSDITEYYIEWSIDSNFTDISNDTIGPVEIYNFAGKNGETYYFRVSAINGIGQALPSNVTFVTQAPLENEILPDPPKITKIAVGNQKLKILFDYPYNIGTGGQMINYDIESTGNIIPKITFDAFDITENPVLSYSITGLTNDQNYEFRMRSYNALGYSTWTTWTNSRYPTSVGLYKPKIDQCVGGNDKILVDFSIDYIKNIPDDYFIIYGPQSAKQDLSNNLSSLTVNDMSLNNLQLINPNLLLENDNNDTFFGEKFTIVDLNNITINSSRIILYGLTTDINYFVIIVTKNLEGLSPFSNFVDVSTITSTSPSKPVIVKAIPANSSFDIEWFDISDGLSPITGYSYILYDENSTQISQGAGNIRKDDGRYIEINYDLSNGITYGASIVLANVNGESENSDIFTGIIPVESTVPEASHFELSKASNDVTINWVDGSNGYAEILRYNILTGDGIYFNDISASINSNVPLSYEVSSNIKFTSLYKYDVSNNLTYTFNDLSNGNYLFVLLTANGNGQAISLIDTIQVGSLPPGKISDLTLIPVTPGGMYMDLEWTAPGDNGDPISDYLVEWATDENFTTDLSSEHIGNNINYSFNTGTSGQTYYFRVSAINGSGPGPVSDTVYADFPYEPPDKPEITDISYGNEQIFLEWNKPGTKGAELEYYQIRVTPDNNIQIDISANGNDLSAILTDPQIVNGTEYNVTIRAYTLGGYGSFSDPSVITPSTVPEAPLLNHNGPGNSSVTLAWDPPIDTGGLPILHYIIDVSTNEANYDISSEIVTYQINDLSNGTPYTFKVKAYNENGYGDYSNESTSIPGTVPDAPILLDISHGNQSLLINWAPPAYNGGVEVEYYRIEIVGSGFPDLSAGNNDTSKLIDMYPLDNGTEYEVRMIAHNSFGDSDYSISLTATPSTIPDPPNNITILTASPALNPNDGNGKCEISWNNPNDGGAPILYWLINVPGIGDISSNTNTNFLITGLTNGTPYNFTIRSVNINGISVSSAPSNPAFVPGTTPSVPINLQGIPGNGSVSLFWLPPSSNGGFLVDDYQINYNNGGGIQIIPSTSGQLSYNLTPLQNGSTYEINVVAHNANGFGGGSSPIFVTPSTTPQAPTIVNASGGLRQATLQWNPPNDNGRADISGYTVWLTDNTNTLIADTSSYVPVSNYPMSKTYYNLTPSQSNTRIFHIEAINKNGPGPDAISSLNSDIKPFPVADVLLTPKYESALLTWSDPSNNLQLGDYYSLSFNTTPPNFVGAQVQYDSDLSYNVTNLQPVPGQEAIITVFSNGVFSDPINSNTVTPYTIPNDIVVNSTVRGALSGQIVSTFQEPSDGGDPINKIKYQLVDLSQNIALDAQIIDVSDNMVDISNFGLPVTFYVITISDLSNGTPYNVRFKALNAAYLEGGEPNYSMFTPSTTAIPGTVPDPPTLTDLSSYDSSGYIAWNPPVWNGGYDVSYYYVTITTGATTIHEGPQVVNYRELQGPDISNGYTYNISIQSASEVGLSAPLSVELTPSRVPDVPTITDVSGEFEKVRLSWTPPYDGGAAILYYTINCDDALIADVSANGSDTSAYIYDLSNGNSYAFRIKATNIKGDSEYSSFSASVAPSGNATAPAAINNLHFLPISPGGLYFNLGWTAPDANGDPITDYLVEWAEDSNFTQGAGSINIGNNYNLVYKFDTGTTGITYYFRVSAINGVGTGPSSNVINDVFPTNKPDAPTISDISAGNKCAILSWTVPNSNGSDILYYIIDTSNNDIADISANNLATSKVILNLENGTTYDFRVKAVNANGSGEFSSFSDQITPVEGSGKPPKAEIYLDNYRVLNGHPNYDLNIINPFNTGSDISSFSWYVNDDYIHTTNVSSYGEIKPNSYGANFWYDNSFQAFKFGETYSVKALFSNVDGSGEMSDTLIFTTPSIEPGVPTIHSLIPGNSEATLTWTAPNDNGSSIIYYTIECSDNNIADISANGSLTSYLITDLSNGNPYSFRIKAINAIGEGLYSQFSETIYVGVPQAPIITDISYGNSSAILSWTAPNDNGSAILYYTIDTSDNDIADISANASATSTVISDLSNGTEYQFRIKAVNSIGEGAFSDFSSPIAPSTIPDIPSIVSVIPGYTELTITWSAPIYDGGSSILYYVLNVTGGQLADISFNSLQLNTTLTGLTNGVTYNFQVKAGNANGESDWSTIESGIPQAVATAPDPPTITSIDSGDSLLTINWSTPNNNGSEILFYTINNTDGYITPDISANGSSNSIIVPSLNNGWNYNFRIRAQNAIGFSDWSTIESGTPLGPQVPSQIGKPSLESGDSKLKLYWEKPNNNDIIPVIYYEIDCSYGNLGHDISQNSSLTTRIFTDLSNLHPYAFRVRGVGQDGAGLWSEFSEIRYPTSQEIYKPLLKRFNFSQDVNDNTKRYLEGGFFAIYDYNIPSEYYLIYGPSTAKQDLSSQLHLLTVSDMSENWLQTNINPDLKLKKGTSKSTVPYTFYNSQSTSMITDKFISFFITKKDSELTNSDTYFGIIALSNLDSFVFSDFVEKLISTGSKPSMPRIDKITTGHQSITVKWTDISNGGLELTSVSYEIADDDGVQSGGGDELFAEPIFARIPVIAQAVNISAEQGFTYPNDYTIKVSNQNFVDGSSYKIRIKANNSLSGSLWTDFSFNNIPKASLPPIISEINLAAVNNDITITWSDISDGGSEINKYTLVTTNGIYFNDISGYLKAQTTISYDAYSSLVDRIYLYKFDISDNTQYTFNDVSNGSHLYFISSENSNGISFSDIKTITLGGATVPDKPDIPSLVGGNAQATLSWSAPFNGGSEILYYTIDCSDNRINDISANGSSTSKVIDLSNGNPYSFRIKAINAIGESYYSEFSNIVTPSTIPSAPTILTVIPGDSLATISWTVPYNGGSSILYYTIDCSDNNIPDISANGSASSKIITDLSNGKPYHFRIRATNVVGNGTYSAFSSSVTPATVPNIPTITGLTGGDGQATLSWTAPFNGGSAILYYTIDCSDNNIADISANGSATSKIITDLSNGNSYHFRIKAVNAKGDGAYSSFSSAVVPSNSVPSEPQNFQADSSLNSINLTWDPPASTGGSAITGYTLYRDGSNKVDLSANDSSYRYTGLSAYTEYSFEIFASNSNGDGVSATLPSEFTSAYSSKDTLPSGQVTYPILIDGSVNIFTTQNTVDTMTSGKFGVTKDSRIFKSETAVMFIDKDISGDDGVLSGLLESINSSFYTIALKTSETGVTSIQKGVLGQLDGAQDLAISDFSGNEITAVISDLGNISYRYVFLTIKEPSAIDLSNNRILNNFYFKLVDISGDVFITNGFNMPFVIDVSNNKASPDVLGILRYNDVSDTYVKITDASKSIGTSYEFNLTTNSLYQIQQLVPDPPTNISLSQVANYVYVNFTPPVFTGPSGEVISDYKVYWTPSNNFQPKKVAVGDISNNQIMIPALLVGTEYTVNVVAINENGESEYSETKKITPTGNSGGVTGDPHITTIYNEQYFLPNINGRFLIFDNDKVNYNLYVTADCYFLTPDEINKAPFKSKYLTNYTFMKTINIKFKGENIAINMNTLDVLYKNSPNVIVEPIINDKMVLSKFYSETRRKELGNTLKFNGKSRKIHFIHKDIRYTITVSVDLNCADHRNDIKIEGPNMASGRGAIISPSQAFKLAKF